MTMKERRAKAEEELRKVIAITKVYELVEEAYHNAFCEVETDEEGHYKSDEEGNYIYREKEYIPSYRFDYDDELYKTCKGLMEEVLDKVVNMK